MTYILYKIGTENSYHTFKIDKKTGGLRVINAPNPALKSVQRKFASLLWETQKKIWKDNNINPNISHGFQEKKSIITNAQIHRNKKYVINVDLKDFFTSFHFGRVKGFFEKNKNFKVPQEVALIIAQLTCYQGVLPQGAPSSPIITNLICKILDYRILKLAKKYKLDYSRYVDDLTFSTNSHLILRQEKEFYLKLKNEIERAGFKINDKKTRLQYNTSRQEVTGLIVNKKINVPKEYYKNTRAMANNLYKYGEFSINGNEATINQLEGRFAFINQLDIWNNLLESESSLNNNNIEYQRFLLSTNRKGKDHHNILQLLNAREKEYQKFLFYKYFYGNEIPTIITEGKTDIRYLKAALKNLYIDYPNLVEKKNNIFYFKIFFFKKSKQKGHNEISRFKYFFNLPADGADSMKNLYNFFSDKNNKLYTNYLKYFNSFNSAKPNNPTFFIFDNEISSKKTKPIKSFFNYVYNGDKKSNSESKLKTLKDNFYLEITDNLFILTHQLLKGNDENELEDLFEQVTLDHMEGEKKFSKDGDNETNYGKEIYSKYVLKNYKNINFDNFRPLLNNLNNILIAYHKNKV